MGRVLQLGHYVLSAAPRANRGTQADLWGVIRLWFNQSEPFDFLKVTVEADNGGFPGESGRGNPEVVLVQRKAAALLSRLHSRVPIANGGGDRLARQYREQPPGFPFEVSSAPSRSQPLQAKQDLAARDGAHNHAIIGSNR